MRIIDCEQGTPEWLQARCGHVTCSNVEKVFKKASGKGRDTYLMQIVAEIISGHPLTKSLKTASVVEGKEHERFARATYEVLTDTDVDQFGFIEHESIELYGGSPDGLVGKPGMIELKVPDLTTHLKYIRDGVVPAEYFAQCMSGMDVFERDWCDFVSFSPVLKDTDPLRIFIKRLYRDEKVIAGYRDEVIKFHADVQKTIEELRAKATRELTYARE